MSGLRKNNRVTVDWSMWDGQSTDITLKKEMSRVANAPANNAGRASATRPLKAAGERKLHLTISKYCC